MESFAFLFKITFKEIADIILVAIFFYFLLILIKGTRAVQIIQGVGILLLLSLISYYLKLEATYWTLHYFLMALAVALPIIFQPELRRALEHLGRRGYNPILSPEKEFKLKFIEEVINSCKVFSKEKIGALIVFEKETGLKEFIETGILVNADISSKLLISIFAPQSPLHDGAVIIREGKAVAASCYLPISENLKTTLEKSFGTRHRAALGLSEQTDALIVIVSEETGEISTAYQGKLNRALDEKTLKEILINMLSSPIKPGSYPATVFKKIGENYDFRIFKKKSKS
ncbi:MAG: TIGR00159 family protein [Armatimonadetes bacterium]|nr:TIGR00159 family protein [Armatimonadota bacterium]